MLDIQHLSVRFRRHGAVPLTVLEDFELRAPRGKVTGIAGASGAGKSLIAAAITATLPRNAEVSGSITVEGDAPSPGTIALSPQGIDALDPLSKIGPQIIRFAKLTGQQVDVGEFLNHLGLEPEVAGAYAHELSGGMAKRACLATTLATGAKWLVADEPTTGLDGPTADRIMSVLADLAGEGYGVLVISHDLPRLSAVADTVAVLEGGRLVETASASAFDGLGDALSHPFSRRLWQAQEIDPRC